MCSCMLVVHMQCAVNWQCYKTLWWHVKQDHIYSLMTMPSINQIKQPLSSFKNTIITEPRWVCCCLVYLHLSFDPNIEGRWLGGLRHVIPLGLEICFLPDQNSSLYSEWHKRDRHYATSLKVIGSSPRWGHIIFFMYLHLPDALWPWCWLSL
jgi:hypothetical protein